jgi:MFS transporter, putative metabolite:H+ symporter
VPRVEPGQQIPRSRDGGLDVSQTDQDVVARALDDARLGGIHKRIFALIAAGYFVDVIDYVIFGSMIPIMLRDHFATRGELALVGSAQLFGLALGTFFQGQFTDRIGRKATYQFNLLLFGVATIVAAFVPNAGWLALVRFIAGLGLGAEQPLAFAYAGEFAPKRLRGRILSFIHFIGGALSWPVAALLALFLSNMFGWRGIWICIGVGALIVFALRFTLPESPRWLMTRGRSREAFETLARMKLPAVPTGVTGRVTGAGRDPFALVWRQYAGRLVAAMVAMSAFFCVTIGFGTWLPNMMSSKGFNITQSLTYSFGMMLAVPCASLFMMFALDRYGRKRTATIAFVAAGLMAIVFALAVSNIELLVVGFVMIFCYQIAGNTLQIFTSEVFPTDARASGFGMAAGIGRLATAGFIPAIPWIQSQFGFLAVFATIAFMLCVAAVSINLVGPETKRRSLEEVASLETAEGTRYAPQRGAEAAWRRP